MPPMPALRTSSELYPPKAPDDVIALLRGIVAFEPARGGAPELSRALAVSERGALEQRKAVLDRWLQPGSPNRMKLAINEMMRGFSGQDLNEEGWDHLNANYAFACRERALWAIERACIRFRMGEVRAEEVGEKTLSRTWKPSSAQLNVLAKSIEAEALRERDKIAEVLKATVYLSPPEDAKTREIPTAISEHWKQQSAVRDLEEARRSVDGEEQRRRESEAAEARRVRTFTDAGVEPPPIKPGQVGTTLQMFLHFGWTVEDGPDGKRILVSPRKQSA